MNGKILHPSYRKLQNTDPNSFKSKSLYGDTNKEKGKGGLLIWRIIDKGARDSLKTDRVTYYKIFFSYVYQKISLFFSRTKNSY